MTANNLFSHGSAILKADFHLHTRRDKEFKYNGADNRFVADYVEALEKAGIRIGLIANHNKFDLKEYKALKAKASGKEIFLLPGVELSITGGNGGLHVLIAFNPDEWITATDDFINKFLDGVFAGIANHGDSNTTCPKGLNDILNILNSEYQKDHFVIFAHVEQSKGLLKECNGTTISTMIESPHFKGSVLAVQKLRTRDEIPKLKKWIGYDLARVEGSDPKSIDKIEKYKDKESYIKIGELSFATVKYALSDHTGRVFDSTESISHGYVESVKFTGGKLNGQTVVLSPYLNTMIGIRGSGKSSLLEIIRWGLDLTAVEDSNYKNSLVNNVLGSGGQISLTVVDGHGKEFEIRKINGESSKILDSSGKDITVSVSTILRNPLYFGQKDLSASKVGYEVKLLDKFVAGKIPDRKSDLTGKIQKVAESIKLLLNLEGIPDKVNRLEEENRELEYKLKIFEEKGLAEKLTKQTEFGKDGVKLDSFVEVGEQLADSLEEFLSKECSLEDFDLSDYKSKYNEELFARLQASIDTLKKHIFELRKMSATISGDVRSLAAIRDEFTALSEQLKEEFAEIKRSVNSENLDLDSFVNAKKKIEVNKTEIEKLKKVQKSDKSIRNAISTAIREKNEILTEQFNAYKTETDGINTSQNELTVNLTFKGDKANLAEALKGLIKGTGIREADVKIKKLCEEFPDSIAIIDDLFLKDGSQLKSLLGNSDYEKLAIRIRESYGDLLSVISENAIEILYHGKQLKNHSIGQRASALILFILSQNQNDIIIIDQPEDDLDNQVVYKEFIKVLKAKKSSVQFIFATHNANIPVLGDSEKIISSEYEDDKMTLSEGTIDTAATHKKIIDIMEGGEEAFQRRNTIYSSWRNIV
jgi:predicted ATPase